MGSKTRLRVAGAVAVAIAGLGGISTGALAQESVSSTVTVGGGTSGVGGGDAIVIAPGVTISGGDVSNETGIGVTIEGGASIGASTGGGDDASLVE